MKYIYRLLPSEGAISFYSSLKAIERELKIYCQLNNRTLVRHEYEPMNDTDTAKWLYTACDTNGEYVEYPIDTITVVHHAFHVERIELRN